MADRERTSPQPGFEGGDPSADAHPALSVAPQPETVLVADSDHSEYSDSDSALGQSLGGWSSASLASSVKNYQYENGRRYHAFRQGQYPLPNDETEQDRLDMLHHIFRMVLGGGLYRAPIARERPAPARILDMGTGTGLWAIEMADELASAVVIGTDLSPIQPGWIPPNLKFYVDDLESEWDYAPGERFDYVHGRGLVGCIRDWPRLFRQVYQNMKPGGFLEMQEFQTFVYCDDDSFKPAKWLPQWVDDINAASSRFGRDLSVASRMKQWMQEAGFVDVTEEIYKVPIGPWAKGKKMKELGVYNRASFLEAVEPYSLALYTRVLGKTTEETQIAVAGVKADMMDPKFHIYNRFYFVYGKKPGPGSEAVG